MTNLAIFASGNGTNAENIIKYFKGSTSIKVTVVVCNNPKANVLNRASQMGTPTEIVHRTELDNQNYIITLLRKYEVDYIILAGFMLLIPAYLIDAYNNKIINIHPSLLPKYGGKGMYGNKIHEIIKVNHEDKTGITIHYVNKEYDKGDIITQFETQVLPSDSVEDIANKVHALEYQYYPQVIESLISIKE